MAVMSSSQARRRLGAGVASVVELAGGGCLHRPPTPLLAVLFCQFLYPIILDELLEPPQEHHQDNYQLTLLGPPADEPGWLSALAVRNEASEGSGVKPQFANEDTAVKMQKIGLCDSLLPEQSRKSLHLPVKLVHASVCSSCNLSTIRDLIRTVQFRPQFSRNGYSMQVRLANGNGN
uniref:Uncharacterized protein n=2 Tax=Oryza TaxID=4527 RepID=A0A0E0PDT6_ORYRU